MTETNPPTVTTWCIYLGAQGADNLLTARTQRVWGANRPDALAGIKEGDLVLLVHHLRSSQIPAPRGFPRVKADLFYASVGKALLVLLWRVGSSVRVDTSRVWTDDTYPHRFTITELGCWEDVELRTLLNRQELEVVRLTCIRPNAIRFPAGSISALKEASTTDSEEPEVEAGGSDTDSGGPVGDVVSEAKSINLLALVDAVLGCLPGVERVHVAYGGDYQVKLDGPLGQVQVRALKQTDHPDRVTVQATVSGAELRIDFSAAESEG